MGKFVRYQADQALVAGNHGWRGEGHARILHAAKRKARRQDEDVVALPAIRAIQLFGSGDHRLGVLELLGRLGDDARLGKHRRARPGRAHVQFADADGEQVGGNRLLHAEAVIAIQRMRNVVVGAHHHAQCLWRGDVRGVGETHRGCVLQRHPAARVDGLRLREHERLLATGGLRRRHPLQARSLWRGVIADAHIRYRGFRVDAQGRAEDRIAWIQRVGEVHGRAIGCDALD